MVRFLQSADPQLTIRLWRTLHAY